MKYILDICPAVKKRASALPDCETLTTKYYLNPFTLSALGLHNFEHWCVWCGCGHESAVDKEAYLLTTSDNSDEVATS